MSDAVAKIEPRQVQPSAQTSDSAVILGMIDRLLARPDVPVEKLEQMFALHQKVQAEAARRAYHAALAELQADIPTVVALGKITGDDKQSGAKVTRSKYAKWEDVNEAIRPALTKHGFALSFRISQPTDASRIEVTAVLSHREGHAEETSLHLPNDPTGGKNNVQAWGSSLSYGKRYTSFAMLNIAARGEDDDGKAAGAGLISADQAEELAKLITATKTDIQAVLDFHKVESLSDMTAADYRTAKAKLVALKVKLAKDAPNARG